MYEYNLDSRTDKEKNNDLEERQYSACYFDNQKSGIVEKGDQTSWQGVFVSLPKEEEKPVRSGPFDIAVYHNYEIKEFEMDARTNEEKAKAMTLAYSTFMSS